MTSVYLIFGEEYLVSNKTKELVEELCPPEQQAFGLEIVDGNVTNATEAVNAIKKVRAGLRTLDLFLTGKLVWLRNASFLSDTATGRSAEVKKWLDILAEDIKKGLPEGQRLIVSTGKADKRYSFFKACKKHGELMEFAIPQKFGDTIKYTRKITKELLKKAELEMRPDTQEHFINLVSTETRQIAQEIDKLRTYMGKPGLVTDEDVSAIVASTSETMSWSLADSVISKDLTKTLALTRQLLAQQSPPLSLIMVLENRFRILRILRKCLERKWLRLSTRGSWTQAEWSTEIEAETTLSSLGKDDPRKLHSFRVSMLAKQAKLFTSDSLTRIRDQLLNTHEQILSSSISPDLIFELLLISIHKELHTPQQKR